jgi:hypothetical protein
MQCPAPVTGISITKVPDTTATISMKYGPSIETDICSTSQEIPCFS